MEAVASWLLSQATGFAGFGARVVFVGLLGLFTSFDVLFSFWNWFDYPTDYILAAAADIVIGWTLAGAVLAAMVMPAKA